MRYLDQWGKGVGIAIRVNGAGIIASIALSPLLLIPEGVAWPAKIIGALYGIVVAPYAFYRGLGLCGLAVRILNQGPINSGTKRKMEELRRESERRRECSSGA